MESSEDFVPRSARIEFMFHMSKAAEERPEFIALKEDTNNRILEFKKFLTNQIIKATKIECEVSSEQIRDSFVKSVRVAVQGFILCDDTTCNLNCDAIVSTIMESRSARLLRHTTFSSVESFYEKYKLVHNLPTFPIRRDQERSSVPQSRFFQSNAASRNNTQSDHTGSLLDPAHHNLDSITRIIESVFIMPFDEYLTQCKKNQISLELKKLSTSHFTEEATANTQMDLDREPALDKSQLQDLIRKHAKAENQLLVKEISKLQLQLKKLDSKNSQRGRSPHRGASNQKEIKQSSHQHSRTTKEKSVQKAAVADKDTTRKSRNQKSKNSKKSTSKSGKQSKTKRNK
jgi:hypothetical protein